MSLTNPSRRPRFRLSAAALLGVAALSALSLPLPATAAALAPQSTPTPVINFNDGTVIHNGLAVTIPVVYTCESDNEVRISLSVLQLSGAFGRVDEVRVPCEEDETLNATITVISTGPAFTKDIAWGEVKLMGQSAPAAKAKKFFLQ